MKVWDTLYCMTNEELNSRQAIGAQLADFIKHDKVEVLLNQVILDKGVGWFLGASLKEVIGVLDGEV